MSNFIYTAGLNNVGSYQVSGAPFTTGSLAPTSYGPDGLKIEFPYVTSWIQIFNHTENLVVFVGFSSEGVQNGNHFRIQKRETDNGSPQSDVLPLKITELWLSGGTAANPLNVDVVAGLTNIPVGRVTAISPSGSNWSGSAGVG